MSATAACLPGLGPSLVFGRIVSVLQCANVAVIVSTQLFNVPCDQLLADHRGSLSWQDAQLRWLRPTGLWKRQCADPANSAIAIGRLYATVHLLKTAVQA